MKIDKENLEKLIDQYAPLLNCHGNLDGKKILTALAYCESDYGQIRRPRFEKSYAPGGYYYQRSPELRTNYSILGAWAACSYGSFQILFQTAYELGFRGSPVLLWIPEDAVGLQYVVELLNKRILPKAQKPQEIADAYNSGSFTDQIIPTDYINEFMDKYNNPI